MKSTFRAAFELLVSLAREGGGGSPTELGCISDIVCRRMKVRFIPSLSKRAKASQHSQPTSAEGGRGWRKRAAHTAIGDGGGGAPDTLLQKRLWELFVLQSDTIFREIEKHDLESSCSDYDYTEV